MKLVGVVRIRNEDDIVEAFARHHLRLLDALVFLDNVSNDRTPEILRALRDEGLPIGICTTRSHTSAEAVQNTHLARHAAGMGADWIVHLDADEFLDPRPLPGSLHAALESAPAAAPAVKTRAVNYHPTGADDPAERVVPRRLRRRDPQCADFVKVMVRGRAIARGATIGEGNHGAWLNGAEIPFFLDERLHLAHYYMRNGWQVIAKAVVGTLKVLAAGEAERRKNTASHYAHIFENLRDHPAWLLDDQAFLDGTRPPEFYGELVDDPIPYLGDALRYTETGEAKGHAVRSIIAATEWLALGHGALADATERTRQIADGWGADFNALPPPATR